MPIWSAEIKELEILYVSFKGQLPDLEKELERLLKTDDENIVLVYARRCLEVIITDLCECELKRPRKTEPLKGIIDKLNKEEKVPSNIITSMDHLNGLSAYGAHPKDFDPEQVKPVLNNLDIIIKWYLKYEVLKTYSKSESKGEIFERKQIVVSPPEKSIIVLPFENMSSDPEQEYFSDGLTEEIITDLSHIHDLLVISRSSAMVFKGTKIPIKEIAEKVKVKYVLEGSVRKAGNNLRIVAQLIDALTDTHLWAEKYNVTLDDVFDIQEKVSKSITESLKLKLSSEEERSISQRPISDIRVYEYYLKAKQEIYSWTESGMERALEYLQKGIEISGDNVLLYFGMGYVYFIYITVGVKNKEECLKKSEQYARKIFELDANSVYGHRLLGLINVRGDLQQGVKQLKSTLEIDPNDSESLSFLVAIYCNTGKQYAAVQYVERLLKTDPYNAAGPICYSFIELLNGHFNIALEKSYVTYNMSPTHPSTLLMHALILAYNNQLEESCFICDQNLKYNKGHIMAQISKCLKFALQGNIAKTKKAMSGGVKSKAICDYYDSWVMAVCDALIGEKDEAITSLEYAVNLGAVNYPWYNEIDPFLENIRGEERFKKLMERVKYEWKKFEV